MASAKQFIERRDNIASIIAYIRSRGEATRVEIASALSLSWACVSELVSIMIGDGVLTETKRSERERGELRGRTPSYITLNKKKYFLGVDINDSGIAVTVIGSDGNKIHSKKWEPESFADRDALADSVCGKIEEMLGVKEDCLGVGVAMEGMRDTDGGWKYPFSGGACPFRPDTVIESRMGLPVYVRHDPECMLYAVAENFDDDCMALRVDNGIGVAVMKGGKILELPLELGFAHRCGRPLKSILRDCAKEGNYAGIAAELGAASANLAMLLGVKTVYIVGEIIGWFDGARDIFDKAFSVVDKNVKYEISKASDASEGAARVAMAEYPIMKEV